MKVKYTSEDNKSHNVEIVGVDFEKSKFITHPVLRAFKVKYEDNKTEWVRPEHIVFSSKQQWKPGEQLPL